VHFTGPRPGEKLYEELFFKGAHVVPTEHPKILRARDAEAASHSVDALEALIRAAQENRPSAEIRRMIGVLVPEYSGGPEGAYAVAEESPADESYTDRTPAEGTAAVAEVGARAIG
jgi:FlaA1/EpsC-like NDP-sugar epimerase